MGLLTALLESTSEGLRVCLPRIHSLEFATACLGLSYLGCPISPAAESFLRIPKSWVLPLLPAPWKKTKDLVILLSSLQPMPSEVPDLDRIIPVLLEHGLERLPEHCKLSPGITHSIGPQG